MRVIAGTAKGVPLKTIKENSTRPTIDRVKESLFNILMPRLQDAEILDCFSGSGSLCIEGLSRGAKSAVFIEANPQAIRVIRDNLRKTRLQERATILQGDARSKMQSLASRKQRFDIIFIDPPHRSGLGQQVMKRINDLQLLKIHGIIVAEHHAREEYPEVLGDLERVDFRVYGNTAISFYQRKNYEVDIPGVL